MDTSNKLNANLLDAFTKLLNQYRSRFIEYNRCHEVRLTNPFIPIIPDNYLSSRRIVYCLKETFGWGKEFAADKASTIFNPQVTPNQLMNLSNRFLNDARKKGTGVAPLRRFLELENIAKQYNASVVYTNLATIGYEYGNTGFDPEINGMLAEIKKYEFSILEPDLILFYTSWRYDNFIKKWIGDFDTVECFPDISSQQLAKLEFNIGPLKDVECYRTYHPQYNFENRKRINEYLNNRIMSNK